MSKIQEFGRSLFSLGTVPAQGVGCGPGSEGLTASKTEPDTFASIFDSADLDGFLEAAFLLKQTGIALASWTRVPVPLEVISVMAATMWGSLDTMVRTLGGQSPRSALLEIDERCILVKPVEPNWTLLLVAGRDVGKRRLRREAQRILERVAAVRLRTVPRYRVAEIRG